MMTPTPVSNPLNLLPKAMLGVIRLKEALIITSLWICKMDQTLCLSQMMNLTKSYRPLQRILRRNIKPLCRWVNWAQMAPMTMIIDPMRGMNLSKIRIMMMMNMSLSPKTGICCQMMARMICLIALSWILQITIHEWLENNILHNQRARILSTVPTWHTWELTQNLKG